MNKSHKKYNIEHVCAQCGKAFKTDRSDSKYCSVECYFARRRGRPIERTMAALRRESERERVRARLAARDAAYAAAYPAMAGGRVRGRVASGWRSCAIRNDAVNVAVSSFIARTREK